MRGKRRKIHRRTLKYFKVNFGISPPFKVIVDGNFAFATHAKKLPVQEYLNRILESEQTTLCTTGAVLNELNTLQGAMRAKCGNSPSEEQSEKLSALDNAYKFSLHLLKLKVFQQRNKRAQKGGDTSTPPIPESKKRKRESQVDDEGEASGSSSDDESDSASSSSSDEGDVAAEKGKMDSNGGDDDNVGTQNNNTSNEATASNSVNQTANKAPLTAAESILQLVGRNNRGKYVIATQDEELKVKLRQIPGVPIISLCRTMLLMDTPSDVSKETVDNNEQKKLVPSKNDRRFLTDLYTKEKKLQNDSQLTAAEAAGESTKTTDAKTGPSKKFLRKLRRQERDRELKRAKYLAKLPAEKPKKTRSRKRSSRKHGESTQE